MKNSRLLNVVGLILTVFLLLINKYDAYAAIAGHENICGCTSNDHLDILSINTSNNTVTCDMYQYNNGWNKTKTNEVISKDMFAGEINVGDTFYYDTLNNKYIFCGDVLKFVKWETNSATSCTLVYTSSKKGIIFNQLTDQNGNEIRGGTWIHDEAGEGYHNYSAEIKNQSTVGLYAELIWYPDDSVHADQNNWTVVNKPNSIRTPLYNINPTNRVKLATPTNLRMNGNLLEWDPVSNAEFYQVYCENLANGYIMGNSANTNSYDVSEWLMDVSNVSYSFTVQAMSPDARYYLTSEVSNPYNYNINLLRIKNMINNPNLSTNQKVSNLKAENRDTMLNAMQDVNNVSKDIKILEDDYNRIHGISVNAISKSPNIGTPGIIGGGFSAADNSTVTLSVDDVNATNKARCDAVRDTDIFKSVIPFEMNISSMPNGGKLDIPVLISIPVPSNMIAENLVILHFVSDPNSNDYDKIYPYVENGIAYFSIDHFSMFAFADMNEENVNPDDNPNNEPENQPSREEVRQNMAKKNSDIRKAAGKDDEIEIFQAYGDNTPIIEKYKKGKLKSLMIAMGPMPEGTEDRRQITICAGTKVAINPELINTDKKKGEVTKFVISEENVSSDNQLSEKVKKSVTKFINKKGVISPKAIKDTRGNIAPSYHFVISFVGTDNNNHEIRVNVISPNMAVLNKMHKKDMKIYSVPKDNFAENYFYVKDSEKETGAPSYRFYIENSMNFVSTAWSVGKENLGAGESTVVGKSKKYPEGIATVTVNKNNGSVYVTPIANTAGTVKLKGTINGKSYTITVKIAK